MRTILSRVLWIATLTAGAAFAQNSDLGLLAGAAVAVSSSVGSGGVRSSVNGSSELNYAIQLRESGGGRLYLELPSILSTSSTDVVAGGNITSSVRGTVFFTPGLRWKFTPASRVSFYAAGGVGFGAFFRVLDVVGGGTVASTNRVTITGALDAGVGLDFRLTRLVSLRAEGRDAMANSRVDGSTHHTFFLIGAGLHF